MQNIKDETETGGRKMNHRQRKKKERNGDIIIILSCDMKIQDKAKAAFLEEKRRCIENQLKKGSVVVIPPELRVEAVRYQKNSGYVAIRVENLEEKS